MRFKGNCAATGIGSLPHISTSSALKLVKENFKEIPYWPQMKKISYKEDMNVQFTSGFPGIVIDENERKIYFDFEKFVKADSHYARTLPLLTKRREMQPKYVRGLKEFMQCKFKKIRAVKGQITSPITFGLGITDKEKNPILRMDELEMPKLIMLHLRNIFIEQEKLLRKKHPQTIIFVDEPSINLVDKAHVLLAAFFELINNCKKGLVGLHCCDNYDWPKLLDLPIDVISFDAYKYAKVFAQSYKSAVLKFIKRGGIIAWGIVPTHDADLIERETADTLINKLEEDALEPLGEIIPKKKLLEHSLITPACGLGSHEVEIAERAVKLTREVSDKLKEKYNLP